METKNYVEALSKVINYRNSTKEHVVILILNNSYEVVDTQIISYRNNNDEAYYDNGKIVSLMNKCGCNKVVLSHNHPDGYLKPSTEDLMATINTIKYLIHRNKYLIDHIIITPDNYYSFDENGVLRACIGDL